MSDINAPAPIDEANLAPEGEEIEQETEEIEAAPIKKEEIAAVKRKLKIKFNNKEEDIEFDPNDDEFLRKQFQMAKLANTKAGEFSQLEKEVTSFIEELRKNPRKALSNPHIGIDIKKLAADIIEEEVENSRKSPEQLEKEQLQQRLQELEEERKKEKDDNRTREMDRLQQQEFERYETLMVKALDKSDLPKSPYVVKKMADYMLMGLNNNLDVTPEDVLPLVREELQADLKEMFAAMPDDVIEAIVGKDVFARVRKKNVLKAKSVPLKAKVVDTGAKDSKSAQPGDKKKSYSDFFGM